MEQGTQEWKEARAGRITASRAADVMAYGKNGRPLKARADYKGELVAEILSGQPLPNVNAKSLSWGLA
jgi:hypothetical protein